MIQTLKSILRPQVLVAGLFALAITLMAVPAAQAGAVTCRVTNAQVGFYEGGQVASQVLYVPGSAVSGCADINVRNIQNLNNPNDHCATFSVMFYPTSGGETYSTPKTVCSKGPNGPVQPLATNVLNGTKYRVIYAVEGSISQRNSFQIVD